MDQWGGQSDSISGKNKLKKNSVEYTIDETHRRRRDDRYTDGRREEELLSRWRLKNQDVREVRKHSRGGKEGGRRKRKERKEETQVGNVKKKDASNRSCPELLHQAKKKTHIVVQKINK